jgi:hypothetical protein
MKPQRHLCMLGTCAAQCLATGASHGAVASRFLIKFGWNPVASPSDGRSSKASPTSILRSIEQLSKSATSVMALADADKLW